MTQFLSSREIYESVICGIVPQVRERLWIATADIKDMYVDTGGRDMVPFLEVLDGMVKCGIEVRLIHAKDPGPNWRDDFDRYPTLWTAMERMLCPRVHFKCIIVDGVKAYFGSANLTGAGMGAKSERKRNFENGVLTDDPALVNTLVEQFDSVWRNAPVPQASGSPTSVARSFAKQSRKRVRAFCRDCGRREHCTDPVV
ncbi:MAG: phospholipase D family protein [Kiritimatiellae bacterium]|nr:phospholipase D family protein [Kiritimatiellia bacterium]